MIYRTVLPILISFRLYYLSPIYYSIQFFTYIVPIQPLHYFHQSNILQYCCYLKKDDNCQRESLSQILKVIRLMHQKLLFEIL